MARDRGAGSEARPVRLFVAFETPERAKDAVAAALEPWREVFPKARWVPRENWHVTVKFLGSTYPRLMEWVSEHARSAAAEVEPFETHLTGLGAFPSRGRGRVLWAGLDDERGQMAAIAGALDRRLAEEFGVEQRAFSPHLTIARSDPPLRLPADFVATPVEAVAFRVDRLTLFRSHLQRPAPRYEPLDVMPLGAGPLRGPAPAR